MKVKTKVQAIRLSKIRWVHAVETGCTSKELIEFGKEHEELSKLIHPCGVCAYYKWCTNCALCKLWGAKCSKPGTLFQKWYKADTPEKRKKIARVILKDLDRC